MAANNLRQFIGFGRGLFPKELSSLHWIFLASILLAFLLGGGSRADISSLLILRPLSALLLGYALIVTKWDTLRRNKSVAIGLALMTLLHFSHLVPLPPAIWTAFPGRQLAIDNLMAANVPVGWRPLSLAPYYTWNSLFALALPIALWLMSCGMLRQKDQSWNAMIVACLAAVSAALGILQVLSGYDSALYLYRTTSNGFATGLFANRNHNGFFLACAIPIAGYLTARYQKASDTTGLPLLLLAAFVLLMLVGVAMTGSRGALGLFVLGFCSLFFFGISASALGGLWRRYLFFGAAGFGVSLILAASLLPFNAISRLGGDDALTELRFQIWPVIWRDLFVYFPVGAGMGTFVDVFQVAEPSDLLSPKYVNHAHNDLLELVLDAGLIGALLIAGGICWWCAAVVRLLRHPVDRELPILGVVIIAMLGLGSVVDYPLRVPSLATLFLLATIWAVWSKDSPVSSRSNATPGS